MRFEYRRIEEWPPLAWLAQCSASNLVITVVHGSMVEVRDDWFCEAVWDGEYEDGGFDTTDLIFGSGGRSRGDVVIFVSSGSTVDRLQALLGEDSVWVSNSLACLLAAADIELDPTYPHYFEHFETIIRGLDQYERVLNIPGKDIQFTYFNNLTWDGAALVEVGKPNEVRDFSTFSKYHDFLISSLGRITENMSAQGRQHPYQMLGTISTGYDSPTVATLACHWGLREAISFTEARGGEADHGSAIAEILGVQLTLISRRAWETRSFPEVPFIAADAKGEDVYFSGAESQLRGRVLLTGFHGDKAWGKDLKSASPNIVRGDQSGLSLTEYRLWAGFIHFPVAFMGVRQLEDINVLSNSAEMAPWDVPGDYSRPICRRIVEEAGVPRNLFGFSKKAASILFGTRDSNLSLATRAEYYEWLRICSSAWRFKGKYPPYVPGRIRETFYLPYKAWLRAVRVMARTAPGPLRAPLNRISQRLQALDQEINLFRYTFPWAIEKAKDRYRVHNSDV